MKGRAWFIAPHDAHVGAQLLAWRDLERDVHANRDEHASP